MRVPDGYTPSNSEVLGDSVLQTAALEDNSHAVRYHSWLQHLAEPFLGEHPIELGSGLGDYAAAWLGRGLQRITVTEADPVRLSRLRERFLGDSRVDVRQIDLDAPPAGAWSSFVSFNVLEHLPDDVGALRSAGRMVRPGGFVVSFVPAFPFAMSRFDRAIGHVRRYTAASLKAAYVDAELDVLQIRYVNAPGLIAWTAGMKVMGMTPKEGPVLRVWDSAIVPLARRVEAHWRPPFGQSVLAVGVARGEA